MSGIDPRSNYEVFRECLSDRILTIVALEDSKSKPSRRQRQRRRRARHRQNGDAASSVVESDSTHGISDGANGVTKEDEDDDESSTGNDGEEMSEFIDVTIPFRLLIPSSPKPIDERSTALTTWMLQNPSMSPPKSSPLFPCPSKP